MAILAPTATDAMRCSRGEEMLFTRGGQYLLNPHAHSTDSDGQLSAEDVAALAERDAVNIALTDHNMPPRLRGKWRPGLVAGMEVLTKGGVDVVVLGSVEGIHKLFEQRIRRLLHRRDPKYRPTGIWTEELLDAAAEYGAWCMHPHYAGVEGLSILPPARQRQILERGRGRTFAEVNTLMTLHANRLAETLAAEWDLPLMTSGDTHHGEHQYTGNYSAVPAAAVPEGDEPLTERLLTAFHARTDRSGDAMLRTGWGEKLQVGTHVVLRNGARVIALYAAKGVGRIIGVQHSASERAIPRRNDQAAPS